MMICSYIPSQTHTPPKNDNQILIISDQLGSYKGHLANTFNNCRGEVDHRTPYFRKKLIVISPAVLKVSEVNPVGKECKAQDFHWHIGNSFF